MIQSGVIKYVGQPESKPTKKGGTYQTLSVIWQQDGESDVRPHSLKDFVDKDLFKKVMGIKPETRVTVNIEKDKNGYWQWQSVDVGGESSVAPQTTPAPQNAGKTGRVVGNTYETPQERGRRQIFINRSMAAKAVLDKMEKLPATAKQWKDFEDDVLKLTDVIFSGYAIQPDDTIKRVEDVAEQDETDDIPY